MGIDVLLIHVFLFSIAMLPVVYRSVNKAKLLVKIGPVVVFMQEIRRRGEYGEYIQCLKSFPRDPITLSKDDWGVQSPPQQSI